MEPRRTAVQRAHRVLLAILGWLLLILLASGVWLSFHYQPSGTFSGAHAQSWVRVSHQVTSQAFVVAALGVFALSIAVSFERALKRGLPAWVIGALLLLVALAASFTGYLLPWDQLALAPLPRGQYLGFGFLFGHSEVKFVLIGIAEVGKATLRRWFFAHTVGVPIALIAVGVVAWRLTRRSRVVTDEETSA